MSEHATENLAANELEAVRQLESAFKDIKRQLSRVIVGQDQVIEELLIALFSRGHCILEGVPGLAKTLMISTLAKCLSLAFSRIQFTPDLMPSDITGTEVIEENRSTGHREFKFIEGPLFANRRKHSLAISRRAPPRAPHPSSACIARCVSTPSRPSGNAAGVSPSEIRSRSLTRSTPARYAFIGSTRRGLQSISNGPPPSSGMM